MYFESFSDFIAMGGHGKYVWIAYVVALAVFAFNVLVPFIKRKQLKAEQARQLRREELHASGS